jgi:hypothetical protein
MACSDDAPDGDANGDVIQSEALSGTWQSTITSFDCDAIAGILSTQQDLRITQDGSQLSASFVDSAGNDVTINGPIEEDTWNATIRVEDRDGRVITARLELTLQQSDLEDVLSGSIDITSDSAMLCSPGERATLRITRLNNPSEQEVFGECGTVDIVIVMDTSGSMDDEADALCSQADGVVSRLRSLGLEDTRLFKWGIVQDADDPEFETSGFFPCLEDHVKRVFEDPVVPGTTDDRLTGPEGDGDEDWADAVSIVAHLGSEGRSPNFQWRSDVVRIVVPISDEGPSKGDPPDEPDDVMAIDNAIVQATANGVIVSPLIANDAKPATATLGRRLAEETDGQAFRTVDPELDLGELLNDIVFSACGGELEPPPPAPSAGPTTLAAADGQGGVYTLDDQDGSEVRVTELAVETPGGGPLNPIEAMVFNERLDRLWASAQTLDETGTEFVNLLIEIAPGGTTSVVSEDDGDPYRDFAQARRTQLIFGTDDDDDLDVIGNVGGRSTSYTDDMEVIAETGNALAFVGDDLFLASGQELWSVDVFSGTPTRVGSLSVVEPPAGLEGFLVVSMTPRPSDGQLFALVAESELPGASTWLATLDPGSARLTLITQTSVPMDGLTWLPEDYFD